MAAVALRRLVRDRTALGFLVVLPVLVIVVVGSTVSGFDEFDVGVVDGGGGPLAAELVDDLEGAGPFAIDTFDDLGAARTALRRAEVDAVVVVPEGFDDDLRAGDVVELPVLGEPTNTYTQAARAAIRAEVAGFAGRVQAAGFVVEHVGGSFEDRLVLVDELAGDVEATGVEVEVVDADSDFLPEGFSYSAPTMLVLFVFLNALAAGGDVLDGKRLGIFARALAAPMRTRGIVAGQAATHLLVAVGQSVLLVGVGAVFFGVDWGDPLAAASLVAVWALIGTGAGLLCGTLFRTAEQAQSIGPPIGIALGMLGGCMWPLEIVPDAMRTIGHLTPHAWAIDAWVEVLSRGGGVADIAGPLAVLGGFAAVLLAVSTRRLATVITS
jgi:ABC-2 type transport system permease protein